MPRYGDEDLGTFFAEMAIEVVWPDTGLRGPGILDEGGEQHDFPSQRSEVIVIEPSVLVMTKDFPGLRKNDLIVVEEASRRVSKAIPEGDGRTTRIYFREA